MMVIERKTDYRKRYITLAILIVRDSGSQRKEQARERISRNIRRYNRTIQK